MPAPTWPSPPEDPAALAAWGKARLLEALDAASDGKPKARRIRVASAGKKMAAMLDGACRVEVWFDAKARAFHMRSVLAEGILDAQQEEVAAAIGEALGVGKVSLRSRGAGNTLTWTWSAAVDSTDPVSLLAAITKVDRGIARAVLLSDGLSSV